MVNEELPELRAELARHAPFQQMLPAQLERFVAAATQRHFAHGAVVLSPEHGPVAHLFCVVRGAVSARRGVADLANPAGGLLYEVGELFPVGALLARRSVTATYESQGESCCLQVPATVVETLAAESRPFSDFLKRRQAQFLELSQRALQASLSSQAFAAQSLESPLASLVALQGQQPAAVPGQMPLAEALALMHERHVGSVLVLAEPGSGSTTPVRGILTRHDLLGRVTLPQLPLSTPIERVMSSPVHMLSASDTAQDAVLLMSRHGIRHVVVTSAGRLLGVVSERDLFALQRLSVKQVGSALREAADVAALRVAAADIRRLATQLLAQGVHARQLTELISQLNDRLTARLVELLAAQHGLDLRRACWLAFGSEGREEQTLATDQDNGLVFVSETPELDRPRWLALGQAVNEALDACGYPLCSGGVMAGQPACCLSTSEWQQRFTHWIEHGAPQDLLNASIYFDLRPIAGALALAAPLRQAIDTQAAATPRFLRQMAQNALQHRPPLNWYGGLAGGAIDLKLQGTAIFVEAARLLALATGAGDTGTRRRLEAAAQRLGIPAAEASAFVAGFEFLQVLRLGVQAGHPAGDAANRVEISTLNEIDQRALRETLRVARRLQQRIELDYMR